MTEVFIQMKHNWNELQESEFKQLLLFFKKILEQKYIGATGAAHNIMHEKPTTG